MYSVDNGIYTALMRATTAPNCNLICRNYAPRFEVRGSLKIKQFDRKSLLHFFLSFNTLTVRQGRTLSDPLSLAPFLLIAASLGGWLVTPKEKHSSQSGVLRKWQVYSDLAGMRKNKMHKSENENSNTSLKKSLPSSLTFEEQAGGYQSAAGHC